MQQCPCCSTKNYTDCCGIFISGAKNPTTPEELMRSRYTAYSQANIEYIARTMKPPASHGYDAQSAREWAIAVTWRKLEVLHTSMANPKKGFVEFIAHYSHNNQDFHIHELSEFHLRKNQWFYVNGKEIKSSDVTDF